MHRWTAAGLVVLLTLSIASARSIAQQSAPVSDLARVQEAIGAAFGFLYALPRDTAGASMGSWVLDTSATTDPQHTRDNWHIVATQLTDTGDALELAEMTAHAGTSPRALGEAMVKMQELDAKISKAEADASLTVRITLDGITLEELRGSERHAGDSVPRIVDGASDSRLNRGYWTKERDQELDVTVDRWIAGELYVRYTAPSPREPRTITVYARGSDEMLERLVKETDWRALDELMK